MTLSHQQRNFVVYGVVTTTARDITNFSDDASEIFIERLAALALEQSVKVQPLRHFALLKQAVLGMLTP